MLLEEVKLGLSLRSQMTWSFTLSRLDRQSYERRNDRTPQYTFLSEPRPLPSFKMLQGRRRHYMFYRCDICIELQGILGKQNVVQG